ncbi:MAG: VOC family protein [Rhodocyclaceae bacterium]
MHIEHMALWASDIDRLASFYTRYFGARASARYTNEQKRFASIFLSFESGARLEVMQRPDVTPRTDTAPVTGYTHLAMSVGSETGVDALTARLVADGFARVDGPRRTGDGYYESVVLDPEGNRIEITV